MPLSRIALQSPAGAARGQVCLVVIDITSQMMNGIVFTLDANIMKIVRLMTFRMKQMNYSESEITFSMSWLRKQVSLLRRLVHPTMKFMELNEFVIMTSVLVYITWLSNLLQDKNKSWIEKSVAFLCWYSTLGLCGQIYPQAFFWEKKRNLIFPEAKINFGKS